MEEGCKNHRETLFSSKGKIVYIVGKPCNIYRLRGNPIVIIGFSRNEAQRSLANLPIALLNDSCGALIVLSIMDFFTSN